MGCDIHIYVEYKEATSKVWYPFGGQFNPGRSYELFDKLGGVRGYSTPETAGRGLPEGTSWVVNYDNEISIDYKLMPNSGSANNCVDYVTAARWVESCGSKHIDITLEGKPRAVTNPDWHSHSWCTSKEFAKVVKYGGPEYKALLAAVRSLERNFETRLIFWFDN
jgi:hypothetical protein